MDEEILRLLEKKRTFQRDSVSSNTNYGDANRILVQKLNKIVLVWLKSGAYFTEKCHFSVIYWKNSKLDSKWVASIKNKLLYTTQFGF